MSVRIMQYTVAGGCKETETDCVKPKWAPYAEAEKQLNDMVEAINGRLGSAVKSASFSTASPMLNADLLYADSGMVTGMLQNGALQRELTVIATRFGHRVDRIETNMGALAPLQQPNMTIFLAKVGTPGSNTAPAAKKAKAKKKSKKKTRKAKKTTKKAATKS